MWCTKPGFSSSVHENCIFFPHLTQVGCFGSGVGGITRMSPYQAEASENEDSWFWSDLGKHAEVKHPRAAAVADSNPSLLRIAHLRIIERHDRHRCTKTARQHQKQNRVFHQLNASSHTVGYSRWMRAAIPHLVAVSLIGPAVWFAAAAPLYNLK
jgi:hypothetical protein